MPMEPCARAPRPNPLALVLAAALGALSGCKSELPAPAYPSPEEPPLEETELWQYFEEPGADEEQADEAWQEEEDESWSEGEGDADTAPEPAPER